jgi:hypothetical protein
MIGLREAVLLGAWLASVATPAWWAYGAGQNAELAKQAREDDVIKKTRQAAQEGAALAIAAIEVQRVEITQPVLREVREKTVYRDCRHSPDGLRGVNAALTGASQPAGPGQLPAAAAAER